MNMGRAISGKYLKASDVEGEPIVRQVKEVRQEQVGQGENAEHKFVLYRNRSIRSVFLVLNKSAIS